MIPLMNVGDTVESLATELVKASKRGKWHTFVGTVAGKSVRIKAYGLWCQIFDINGISHAHGVECKTQKAFRAYIADAMK